VPVPGLLWAQSHSHHHQHLQLVNHEVPPHRPFSNAFWTVGRETTDEVYDMNGQAFQWAHLVTYPAARFNSKLSCV
jgi:hypothetical protein